LTSTFTIANKDHIINLSRLFYTAEIKVFQTVDLHTIKRKIITKTKCSHSEVEQNMDGRLRLGTHKEGGRFLNGRTT
jgi:hypothetical protein